jgi:catechol 2,3-dioxygenase-like lactoylglutathione lyase family enzyme
VCDVVHQYPPDDARLGASGTHPGGDPVADQPINRVATVFLPVSDQDRSLAFFRDQLGFNVSDVSYGEGLRWVEVVPPGSATVIALNGPSDQRPGFQPGTMAPFSFDTDDLDAAMAELSARGVEFDEPIRMPPPVPPMVYFRDPDDNQMLLIQRDH